MKLYIYYLAFDRQFICKKNHLLSMKDGKKQLFFFWKRLNWKDEKDTVKEGNK